MVSGGIAKGRLFHWLPVFPVSSLRSGAYNWQPPWLQVVSVGLLGLADRETRLGGSPLLSCKRDQIKMRDYMDRRLPDLSQTSYLPSPAPPPPHLYLNRPLHS